MKKKLFLAVLIVFFASTAWAEVEFDLSGDAQVRGSYFKNFGQITNPAAEKSTFTNYDGDFNLCPKITIDDNLTLNFTIAMKDETWADIRHENENIPDPLRNSTYNAYTNEKDDNINVERAWLRYMLNKNTALNVGLMDGNNWATTFGNYVMGFYRVTVEHATPHALVGAVIEKDAELGNTEKDSEKDDFDAYGLWAMTRLGTVNIKPLIWYTKNSAFYRELVQPTVIIGSTPYTNVLAITMQDKGNDGLNVWHGALALDGTIGPLEFESEINYNSLKVKGSLIAVNNFVVDAGGAPFVWKQAGEALDTYDNDWTLWGAYLNVWKTFAFAKPGLTLAYGSWDDKGGFTKTGAGFDFRDDFCSNLILGDWIAWGDMEGAEEDLVGMTLIKPYVQNVKTPFKKLTARGSFGYVISNQKDTLYEDAKAMEVDLGFDYKFTKNLTYSVDAGYADLSYDVIDDPDPIIMVQHKLKVTF